VSEKNGVHWSVDFVEHLRAVHFALVSLAIALSILISGGPSQQATAIKQARAIQEATEHWDGVRSEIYRLEAQKRSQSGPKSFEVALTQSNSLHHIDFDAHLNAYDAKTMIGVYFDGLDARSPKNLNDFRLICNTLQTSGGFIWLPNWEKSPDNCVATSQDLTELTSYSCSVGWEPDPGASPMSMQGGFVRFGEYIQGKVGVVVSDSQSNALSLQSEPTKIGRIDTHISLGIPASKVAFGLDYLKSTYGWRSGTFESVFAAVTFVRDIHCRKNDSNRGNPHLD
jgi:hypothetical protein